ncbi:MAG: EamA family transporter [Casimicrobiaceae bacterium]
MYRGVIYALGSAVLFGMSIPLAKLLVGVVSPLLLAGLLYAGAGLGLLLVLGVRRRWTHQGTAANLPRPGEWRWLAAAIFFGGLAGPVALMYGLVTTAASTASLMLNLEAVFTALFAWFVFRENFDRRVGLGMLAIVSGGLLLAWTPGESGQASLGSLLIALACICWALDNNLTRKVAASDAVAIAGIKGLIAGAVSLSLALLLGDTLPAMRVIGAAAVVGFLGYGVSLVLFVLALRHLGSARTGAYFSVAPFFGAALAFLLQGEAVTWQLIVAGVLMALGVWLHLTEHHSHRHQHEQQEHSHPHTHDEHHRHTHDGWDGSEPHTHFHTHVPLVHSHVHYPDMHHRHPH